MYRVKNEEKLEMLRDQKRFTRIVGISIAIGIIIVTGFIIYYLLTPEPGFVVFGILNSEGKAEDYPTEASVGENVSFYTTVDNYLNRDFTFRIEILRGDNDTILSKTEPAKNAESFYNTTQYTIKHNERWISDMLNITFMSLGSNQIIIAELWKIIDINTEKFNNNLWIRLNITS